MREPGPTDDEIAAAIAEALSEPDDENPEPFDVWFARVAAVALADDGEMTLNRSEREARRKRALDAFHAVESPYTGKSLTGDGAATYAQDFTRDERSAVADALDEQSDS